MDKELNDLDIAVMSVHELAEAVMEVGRDMAGGEAMRWKGDPPRLIQKVVAIRPDVFAELKTKHKLFMKRSATGCVAKAAGFEVRLTRSRYFGEGHTYTWGKRIAKT